ncbi:hypothetical protein KAR91_23445, partial [Candidatus Pacearchaeota archaeon]|nr:hypothetical protein [Candidatus Pacearchaeota archaeon]
MSLLDRVSKIGTVRAVEVDGLTVHIKTKNVRQHAIFQDSFSALNGKTELECVDNLIGILVEAIVSIDDVDNVEEFLGNVPTSSDLIVIGKAINKAMSEKEAKNSSSPSESPTSTVNA